MADNNTVLVAVITAVSSGGIVGAIATLIKVRPEAGQILIKSATDVVMIQRGAMTDLQQRLTNVERERDMLQNRVTELEQAVARLQRGEKS